MLGVSFSPGSTNTMTLETWSPTAAVWIGDGRTLSTPHGVELCDVATDPTTAPRAVSITPRPR